MTTTPERLRHVLNVAAGVAAFADGNRVTSGICIIGVARWHDAAVKVHKSAGFTRVSAAQLDTLGGGRDVTKYLHLPSPAKPWKVLLAGEQFLHGTLFDLALLDEELPKGVDEGIRIAQCRS